MCKYCDNKENEPIWKGSVFAIKVLDKQLSIEVDLNSYEYLLLDIEFCPMCGKELILSMYN